MTGAAKIEWAQEGTEWWYYTTNFIHTESDYFLCTGQAEIDGKICQVVKYENMTYYTYEEAGKVFFYNAEDSIFVLRFDFNAQAGESWLCTENNVDIYTCYVDSVTTMEIAGQIYPVQHIRIVNPAIPCCDAYESVIAGIGSDKSFSLPVPTDLTPEIWWGLGCFHSATTGLIQFSTLLDCETLALPVEEENVEFSTLRVYPNPSSGQSTLSYSLPSFTDVEVRIYDSMGKQLATHQISTNSGNLTLTLEDYPAGFYLAALTVQGRPAGKYKFIKL